MLGWFYCMGVTMEFLVLAECDESVLKVAYFCAAQSTEMVSDWYKGMRINWKNN